MAGNPSLGRIPGRPTDRSCHWREDALGIIVGLMHCQTQFTRKGHIVRAMLEAVAFQVPPPLARRLEYDVCGSMLSPCLRRQA